MARGQKWTGPIVEETIERASPGLWCMEIPMDGDLIRISIVKSSAYGPYLVVGGGAACHNAFTKMTNLASKLSSGVLIIIEYSDDVVPALETPELRSIIDEADEVIVTGPLGCVLWDRLSNRRFRAIDEIDVFSETLQSMRELDLISERAGKVTHTAKPALQGK